MSKTTQNILRVSGWLVTIVGVFVLLGFVSGSQEEMLCNELIIKIDDGRGTMNFINEEQIRTKLANQGHLVVDEPMSALHLEEFEAMIMNIPSVEMAEVFKTIDGKVIVEVKQRQPILRIINKDSTSFYVDDHGKTMPLSDHFTARVMVFNGHVQEPVGGLSVDDIVANDSLAEAHLMDDIYKIATYTQQHDFWRAQVQHIYINEKGEMEIIPLVGNHRIIFGSVENMEQKFRKLKLFYDRALKNEDWNMYETINLKYDKQIVCTKKE